MELGRRCVRLRPGCESTAIFLRKAGFLNLETVPIKIDVQSPALEDKKGRRFISHPIEVGIMSLKVANPTFSFWRAVLGNIVRCASCQWAGWKLARTVNSLVSYLRIKKTQVRGQRGLPLPCALRISVARQWPWEVPGVCSLSPSVRALYLL